MTKHLHSERTRRVQDYERKSEETERSQKDITGYKQGVRFNNSDNVLKKEEYLC